MFVLPKKRLESDLLDTETAEKSINEINSTQKKKINSKQQLLHKRKFACVSIDIFTLAASRDYQKSIYKLVARLAT